MSAGGIYAVTVSYNCIKYIRSEHDLASLEFFYENEKLLQRDATPSGGLLSVRGTCATSISKGRASDFR